VDDYFEAAMVWRWTDPEATPTDTNPNEIELALHCYDDGGASAVEPRAILTARFSGDHHLSTDNSNVTEVGVWNTSAGGWPDTDYNQYEQDGNTGKGSKTITIRPLDPTIFKGHAYTVSGYSVGGSFDTAAPFTIHHNGTSTSGTWDQSVAGWTELATVTFSGDPAHDERIVISNTGTTATVLADSFRIEGQVHFSICLKGKDGDLPDDNTFQFWCEGTPGQLTSGMGSFDTSQSVTSIDSLEIARAGTPSCCKECGVCCFDRLSTISWDEERNGECFNPGDSTCSSLVKTIAIAHYQSTWPAADVPFNSTPVDMEAIFVSLESVSGNYYWTQVVYKCVDDTWYQRYDTLPYGTLAAALAAGKPSSWANSLATPPGTTSQDDCCGFVSEEVTACVFDIANRCLLGSSAYTRNKNTYGIEVKLNGCCRDATAETPFLCSDDFNGPKAPADCPCRTDLTDDDCDGDCEEGI
jgi:hypothetical protein